VLITLVSRGSSFSLVLNSVLYFKVFLTLVWLSLFGRTMFPLDRLSIPPNLFKYKRLPSPATSRLVVGMLSTVIDTANFGFFLCSRRIMFDIICQKLVS